MHCTASLCFALHWSPSFLNLCYSHGQLDGILEKKQGNIPISELRLAPSIYALRLLAPTIPPTPSSLYPSLSISLIIIMAMVIDQRQAEQQQQQQVYKHYCRICKKGFGCGRALGGHMRAHGLIDDAAGTSADADDTSGYGEWDREKLSGGGATKRMYALRTHSNRLKSCRVCENCGKEFISWKSFLEHGKCISDDEAGEDDDDDSSFPSSPRSYDDDLVGWSKGKRSRRTKVAMTEEEDLANCLVMLSSARVDPVFALIETEESCASASKEDDRRRNTVNTNATGVVEATAATTPKALPPPFALQAPPAVPKGLFECKACKKVFTSHQALGGHRASHKKVKGCFAAKLSALDETPSPPADEEIIIATHNMNNASSSDQMAEASMSMALVPIENPAPLAVAPVAKKKSKVHECSICHRVFTSGQALGGHKRCHWITSNSPSDPTLKLQPLPGHAGLHQQLTLRPMFDANSNSEHFDLNMPPINDAVRRDIGSSLRLEIPAAIYLRSWINDRDNASKNRASITTSSDMKNNNNDQNHTTTNIHNKDNITCNEISSFNHVEDEVESKVKLAKLSELKDINMGEESSDWLQVGIGSSANEGSEA
ncbi:uncharacterized protein LOC122038926 [Zingiber officinale]|nr:uncharacterized protein LOC122038926 [Zingiber officinale]